MKIGKYILAIAAAALVGLTGCIRDKFTEMPDVPRTSSFTVSVAMPSTEGATRAVGDQRDTEWLQKESDTAEFDVLLYNSSTREVLAWIYIDQINNQHQDFKSFRVELPGTMPNVSYKMAVLANSHSYFRYVFGGEADQVDVAAMGLGLDDVYADFYYQYSKNALAGGNITAMSGLPLWGETEASFTLPVNTIATVQMVRFHAKMDILVDESLHDVFAMTAYRIPRMYDCFKIVPDNGVYSHSSREVSSPSLYGANTALVQKDGDIPAASAHAYRDLFTSEYPNATANYEYYVLIKADYGPVGNRLSGWYKVKITDGAGTRIDIRRNHRYVVKIMEVSGPGYESPEEALENNTYIEADIEEWNDANQNVVMDGDFYLKVSCPTLTLYREAGYVYMDIETNFPGYGDPWDAGYLSPGIVFPSNGTPNSMTVTDVSGTNGSMTRRVQVAWKNWEEVTAVEHTPFWSSTLTVCAGNMEYRIPVIQWEYSWLDVSPMYVLSDGMYHEFPVESPVDWQVTANGSAGAYELITNNSKESSDRVFFKVLHDDTPEVAYEMMLTFTNDEYHYPAKDVPVVIGNPFHESNCYVLEPASLIILPVTRANRSDLGPDWVKSDDEIEHTFVWTEIGPIALMPNLYYSFTYGTGLDAVVCAKAGDRNGNAVVGITVNGEIKWSWHMWINEEKALIEAGTGDGNRWMDRNLGATLGYSINGSTITPSHTAPSGTGVLNEETRGLHYQWGRKDAFPRGSYYDENGKFTYFSLENNVVNSITDLASAVGDPVRFSDADFGWKGSNGAQSWNDGGAKTIYDPCPSGWKVPVSMPPVGTYTFTDRMIIVPDCGVFPMVPVTEGISTYPEIGGYFDASSYTSDTTRYNIYTIRAPGVTSYENLFRNSAMTNIRCVRE